MTCLWNGLSGMIKEMPQVIPLLYNLSRKHFARHFPKAANNLGAFSDQMLKAPVSWLKLLPRRQHTRQVCRGCRIFKVYVTPTHGYKIKYDDRRETFPTSHSP